jgi:hypothetical protein
VRLDWSSVYWKVTAPDIVLKNTPLAARTVTRALHFLTEGGWLVAVSTVGLPLLIDHHCYRCFGISLLAWVRHSLIATRINLFHIAR